MLVINWKTEIVGIIGSALILISMLYKTNTYKGAFFLRFINAIGSIVYIVYGFMLPSLTTILLNIFSTFINSYYLIRLKKDYQTESLKDNK